MITKGYYKESRNVVLFSLGTEVSNAVDFGNGSDNVIFYNKTIDFSKIDYMNFIASGDKMADASADNTVTLTIGGVSKAVLTLPDTTEVNMLEVVDCTSITGNQIVKIQGGGGTDNLNVYTLHLSIVEA